MDSDSEFDTGSESSDSAYFTCEEEFYTPFLEELKKKISSDQRYENSCDNIVELEINANEKCISYVPISVSLHSNITYKRSSTSSSSDSNSNLTVNSIPPNRPVSWKIPFEKDVDPHENLEFLKEKTSDIVVTFERPDVHADDISKNKVLDLRRWYCMSRPQYSKSCGISSLVSVWNFLYSRIGSGELPPISQEHAMNLLGFKPPFNEIAFGAFTGNATLMKWFSRLNAHFGVSGRASYLYKPKGRCKTNWMTDEHALALLKHGLRGDSTAFIYHCLNHYFCPIGFEDTPQDPTLAYFGPPEIDVNCECPDENDCKCRKTVETWVLIGEPSKKQPSIHSKRWKDISLDLNMESPNFYNIRKQEKGIFTKKTRKRGTNLHCIISFHKH